MRELLRSLPVFAGPLPPFDARRVPASPVELFTAWLQAAIAAGAPEPHAVTLSTVDGEGRPDARVLILKDVEESGWSFASSAVSAKGRQLTAASQAALSAYWPAQGRQVRIRGEVGEVGRADSGRDFLARSSGARAMALLSRQSQVLTAPGGVETALAAAAQRLAADPDLVAPDWTLYRLVAQEVEFWQATASRRHTRLRYRREGQEWRREQLWP